MADYYFDPIPMIQTTATDGIMDNPYAAWLDPGAMKQVINVAGDGYDSLNADLNVELYFDTTLSENVLLASYLQRPDLSTDFKKLFQATATQETSIIGELGLNQLQLAGTCLQKTKAPVPLSFLVYVESDAVQKNTGYGLLAVLELLFSALPQKTSGTGESTFKEVFAPVAIQKTKLRGILGETESADLSVGKQLTKVVSELTTMRVLEAFAHYPRPDPFLNRWVVRQVTNCYGSWDSDRAKKYRGEPDQITSASVVLTVYPPLFSSRVVQKTGSVGDFFLYSKLGPDDVKEVKQITNSLSDLTLVQEMHSGSANIEKTLAYARLTEESYVKSNVTQSSSSYARLTEEHFVGSIGTQSGSAFGDLTKTV